MRIGFVIPYFYPALEYGGTPRVAYEFARSLVRRGHQVTVVTTDAGGRNRIGGPSAILDGVKVFYYPNLSNYLAYKQRLFFPPRLFRSIQRDLSSFDIVHIHEFRSLLTVAAHSALRKLNIPYVLSPHGGLQRLGKERLKTLFDRLWGRRILRDAAALCAVSNLEIQDAAQYGIRTQRISLLPNPIDEDLYKTLPPCGRFIEKWNLIGKRVVLFLGRLNWIKGIDVLIDAVPLLADIPNLHLVIAGPDDGAEEALRTRALNKQLAEKVTFTGFLNDSEKLHALVDSQLVVLPSRREGFPGTALEALAAAKPVVLSSMCGTVDGLSGGPGTTVFRNGDPRDLANKLRDVLQRGADPKHLLDTRNLVLREFSTDALAAKAEDLYQSVLATD
jgi:glycosyltransferase involved in cell wall biosynthesis